MTPRVVLNGAPQYVHGLPGQDVGLPDDIDDVVGSATKRCRRDASARFIECDELGRSSEEMVIGTVNESLNAAGCVLRTALGARHELLDRGPASRRLVG